MNPLGVPGINVNEMADRRDNGDDFILLDVREPHELAVANLGDWVLTAPLSELAKQGPSVLPEAAQDKSAEIIVMCHHGGRSAQVTAWLRQQGWENVTNLDGGIHAYSLYIDSDIPTY